MLMTLARFPHWFWEHNVCLIINILAFLAMTIFPRFCHCFCTWTCTTKNSNASKSYSLAITSINENALWMAPQHHFPLHSTWSYHDSHLKYIFSPSVCDYLHNICLGIILIEGIPTYPPFFLIFFHSTTYCHDQFPNIAIRCKQNKYTSLVVAIYAQG